MRYKRKSKYGGKRTSTYALDCVDEVMFDGKSRTTNEVLSGIWDIIKRKRANRRLTKREAQNRKNKKGYRIRPTGSTAVPTKNELWNYFKLHPEYEKVIKGTWRYTGEIPKSHIKLLRNRRKRRINRIQKILRE